MAEELEVIDEKEVPSNDIDLSKPIDDGDGEQGTLF